MSVAPPAGAAPAASSADAVLAVRNSVKLGGSLLCTWGIALGARLLLPRYLGPEAFGALNFADAFATTWFVVLGLGLDTYVRKEIPVRPAHASDFFGGMLVLRGAVAIAVFGAMALVIHLTDRSPEVARLAFVFGAAQVVLSLNSTLSAMLHAHGTIDGLSITNVVSKLVWGSGILLTLALEASLVGIPLALLVSELGKSVVLGTLVRKNLTLRFYFRLGAAGRVVLASLPFYLSVVAHTVYNKLDVSLLAVVANDQEVGWYGAASTLAGLTMLIAPLFGWVIMPLFARTRSRSSDEYTRMVRRSLELILAVAIPTSLAMALGAELWIEAVFGPAFAPAAQALRILAPLFLLTYVAMIGGICLMIEERAWTMTAISIGGLVVNPLLNLLLIKPSMRFFGTAGGGSGCALAQLVTELVVTAAMMAAVGRRAFDRRTLVMVAKSLAVAFVVIAFHRALGAPPALGLFFDALLFGTLFVLVRAIPLRETYDFARGAFRRRGEPEAG